MNNFEKYLQTKSMIGIWKSKRLILDNFNGNIALYSGIMNISPADKVIEKMKEDSNKSFTELHLREEGVLIINEKRFQFSQKYQLQLFDSHFDVLFREKVPFFSVNRITETQAIHHFCKLDRYDGQISFVNRSAFFLRFNVSGPKKNYYLKVLYKR